jgi:hypothetical protein
MNEKHVSVFEVLLKKISYIEKKNIHFTTTLKNVI